MSNWSGLYKRSCERIPDRRRLLESSDSLRKTIHYLHSGSRLRFEISVPMFPMVPAILAELLKSSGSFQEVTDIVRAIGIH